MWILSKERRSSETGSKLGPCHPLKDEKAIKAFQPVSYFVSAENDIYSSNRMLGYH